jgi:DNA-binding helix-hairpin-helix protein with protein kinase domain
MMSFSRSVNVSMILELLVLAVLMVVVMMIVVMVVMRVFASCWESVTHHLVSVYSSVLMAKMRFVLFLL